MAYTLGPWDREWFKRCRRAWDFGSRQRQNLEPVGGEPGAPDLDRAVRDALAVYYFPGMWEWNRDIVIPLTYQAMEKPLVGREPELAAGRDILTRYLEWAPTVDAFWPVRVETSFYAGIPHPDRPGEDLITPDGHHELRYEGKVDLLVVDEHDAYWMVRHHLVEEAFTEVELLMLDDEMVAACWGWENFYIGMRVSGTIHNEIRLGTKAPEPGDAIRRPRPNRLWAEARAEAKGAAHRRMYARAAVETTEVHIDTGGDMFRRTRIPRPQAELEAFRARLGAEALDMVRVGLPLYPTAAAHCAGCDYREPCLAMNEGADPAPILAEQYRVRPDELPEEGKLGAVTWSMNRGAAPPPHWRRKKHSS